MPTPHKTFEKVLSKDEILTRLYFVIPYDLPHSTKKIEVIFARYFSIANGRIDYAYDMGFEAGQTHGEDILDASKLSEEEAKVCFTNPNQAIRCTMKTLAELIGNAEKAKAHFITQSIRRWLKSKEQDDGFIAIDIKEFDAEFKTKDAKCQLQVESEAGLVNDC